MNAKSPRTPREKRQGERKKIVQERNSLCSFLGVPHLGVLGVLAFSSLYSNTAHAPSSFTLNVPYVAGHTIIFWMSAPGVSLSSTAKPIQKPAPLFTGNTA